MVAPAQLGKLKLFFFDFDDTLVTKAEKLRDTRRNPPQILPFKDELIELKPGCYTTKSVIDILSQIQSDPNSLWFIVSRGNNKEQYSGLKEHMSKRGVELTPKHEIWRDKDNLKVDNIKKLKNEMMTRYNKSDNDVTCLFVDDDNDNIVNPVNNTNRFTGTGVETLLVKSHVYKTESPDVLMEHWFLNSTTEQKTEYGARRTNLFYNAREGDKIINGWLITEVTEQFFKLWLEGPCPKVICDKEKREIEKFLNA